MIPDMRSSVVFPYHIRKFIAATSKRTVSVLKRNRIGSAILPVIKAILLTGPESEKRTKKSMANADAMIRFGIYITVLKKLRHLKRNSVSVNQIDRSREISICGINPSSHIIRVFSAYFGSSLLVR